MPERIRQIVRPAAPPPGATVSKGDINVRSVALTVIAFAATMYVLHWAQEAFIPIVLSILISYAAGGGGRRGDAGHDAARIRRLLAL